MTRRLNRAGGQQLLNLMKVAISEIVGKATDSRGTQTAVYRALRPLLCSRCGKGIEENELFTRKKLAGVRISPCCGECAPFELQTSDQSGSQLLKALLSPEASVENSEKAQPDRKVTAVEVERRLGPALAHCRKRRR
jgi:hypothetical protein